MLSGLPEVGAVALKLLLIKRATNLETRDRLLAMDSGSRRRGRLRVRNRTWVHLLSYCVALVLAGSLFIAALVASVSLAFGMGGDPASAPQDSTSPITVSGLISDSHCGAKHATQSGNVPAQCSRVCVRSGAKYVVVNGDATYVLLGSETTFDAFAGQRAQVNGTLNGDTLKVTSIRAQ
jgi:hypothetical protein